MNEITTQQSIIPDQTGSSLANIKTGINLFDSGAFEKMFRIAESLAGSSLIPTSLKEVKGKELPKETVVSNCLLIVEQAARWGLSPFAVIGHASVVHGRLMWEGKLVSAVLETAGIRLNVKYSGDGEGRTITLTGRLPGDDDDRTVTGSVKDWKTMGDGSPWKPSAYDRQLHYRGTREWSRIHAPWVMLGIYTPDEMDEIQPSETKTTRFVREIPINPAEPVLIASQTEPIQKTTSAKTAPVARTAKSKIAYFQGISLEGQAWMVLFKSGTQTAVFTCHNPSIANMLEETPILTKMKIDYIDDGAEFTLQSVSEVADTQKNGELI